MSGRLTPEELEEVLTTLVMPLPNLSPYPEAYESIRAHIGAIEEELARAQEGLRREWELAERLRVQVSDLDSENTQLLNQLEWWWRLLMRRIGIAREALEGKA